ncbi:mercury methylation corrinoid protein HgcA [Acidobacteriota bacterium]
MSHSVKTTTSDLFWKNRLDHFAARCGYRRSSHHVSPGLYVLGKPRPDSPVFVTANYTLSFDSLRSSLSGMSAYLLVLDTKGINVWCAAGKGTFGTEELCQRIENVELKTVVNHRELIVPQLGATGIAAHTVRKRTGFKVNFGPVRAEDIPAYIERGQVTEEMRQVRFGLAERIPLMPVELVHGLIPMSIVFVLLYFLTGPIFAGGIIASSFAGLVLFPLLLPWIPTPNFSTKGFILGGIVTIPFILLLFMSLPAPSLSVRILRTVSLLLISMPVTGFLSLNFTGSTTFTSKSGVKMEFKLYVPVMVWMLCLGVLSYCFSSFLKYFGA